MPIANVRKQRTLGTVARYRADLDCHFHARSPFLGCMRPAYAKKQIGASCAPLGVLKLCWNAPFERKVRLIFEPGHPPMFDRREFLKVGGIGTAALLGGNSLVATRAIGAESKLIVHTVTPRNAEPPLNQLVKAWITPNEHFYIRSHAPVP